MNRNIVLLGVVALIVPLFLLIASSSLWLGQIDLVEAFPRQEQICHTDAECIAVDSNCGEQVCDHAISQNNFEKYAETNDAACTDPFDKRIVLKSHRKTCKYEAYCNQGVCDVRPIHKRAL